MAINTYAGFTPDGSIGAAFGASSSRILLPGASVSTDGLVLVTNVGPLPAGVVLGDVTAVATTNGSLCLMPGKSIFLARAAATYLAAIAHGPLTGQFTMLNVTTGN